MNDSSGAPDASSSSVPQELLTQTNKLSLSAERTLSLASVKGFGVNTFNRLHDYFGSVDAIWQASYEDFLSSELNPVISRSICDVRDRHEKQKGHPTKAKLETWLASDKRFLLSIDDLPYPAILKEIHGAPPCLYIEGNLEAISSTSIGMVGSRNASIAGKQNAQLFAKDLALNQVGIASGLALGIDGAAHRGALEADGVTLAVLATGLDVVYPRKHTKLAEEIKERGALISEMSLGTLPIPANFPRRNRVISGLSAGVVVVEASIKSGSLITAQYAIEQNREVFAIPGAVSNPLSQGCHHLIKQGALLVESANDVMEGLSFSIRTTSHSNKVDDVDLSEEEERILKGLGHGQASFDELVASTQMPIQLLSTHMMTLELKGLVASIPGGYQRI